MKLPMNTFTLQWQGFISIDFNMKHYFKKRILLCIALMLVASLCPGRVSPTEDPALQWQGFISNLNKASENGISSEKYN
jgi:hypothetical protein